MPDHINRYENDKLPMLSDMHTQQLDEHVETPFHQLSRKPNQSSLSIISCLPTCVENHLSKETKPGRSEKTAPSIQINDLKNESKLQGSWDPYRPTQGALENKKFSSEGFSKYHGTGKDKVVKNYYKDKNKQPLDTCPEYLDEHKASQLHWSRTWTHDMPESSEPAKNDGIAQVIPTSGLLYKGQKPQDHHTSVSGALMENNKEPSTEGFPTFNSKVRNAFLENEHDQKFKHLLKSGPLGMCHDPYCTTCPSHWNYKGAPKRKGRTDIFSPKFRDTLYGGARGWARRFGSSLNSWLPGVVNPHAKIVQQWNKFFVISCLVSIFVDPLCFFLFYARQDYKCIVLNWVMTRTIVVFRSITDFIYLLHILLQGKKMQHQSKLMQPLQTPLVDNLA